MRETRARAHRQAEAASRCLHFPLKGYLECDVGQDCCSVHFVCRSSRLYARVIHRQVVELAGEETDPLNWHDKRIYRNYSRSVCITPASVLSSLSQIVEIYLFATCESTKRTLQII